MNLCRFLCEKDFEKVCSTCRRRYMGRRKLLCCKVSMLCNIAQAEVRIVSGLRRALPFYCDVVNFE